VSKAASVRIANEMIRAIDTKSVPLNGT
jgi:hypothetical protein